MLFQLFITFFIAGLVSFGGGYAMIPLIQEEVLNRHHWMDAAQLVDIVAIAGMSPGPIATNIAVAVGFRQAGMTGAVVSSFAVVLPAFLILLALGKIFARFHDHPLMKSSFYGLRPIVAGMILYAAILFAEQSGMLTGFSWYTWSQILIFAGSLAALMIWRKHPLYIIVLSGLIGIAIYS